MEPNYGYKHTRGFIVFLIIIFCGWVIVAHSQVSNTGNLVDNSWSNGYPVSALTCWGNEQGTTNCSPGGIPYVRPDGNINFSYAATELYQARTLADVLPYSGTGLMVTGFQYNWRSKNGNGWDDGRLDVLQAYVQMYSKSGQWIESQTYSLNFLHNWTDFAWSGTFSKERRGSDLGTVIYGFYGKDNNYWLGPYGPEIMNVSFSLRYQPDPCVVNPLHSTDCPGFMSAINRPIPGIQSENTTTTVSASGTSSTSTSASTALGTAMSVIKLNAQREQGIVDAAVELATSMIASESRQTTTASSASITLNQSQQRATISTIELGSAGQEQDNSISNSSSGAIPALAQNQPSTGQRVQNAAANSSQTTADTESVATSSTVSAQSTMAPAQLNQAQRTNTKMVDTNGQQDQEQFATPPAQSTMAFTAPAPPVVVTKTTTRNQDSQTSAIEQEQTQTVSIASSTAIVPVQLPTVQKAVQRSDSQTKIDVANDTTNVVDQFIAQNTAASQTTASATPVLQPGPVRSTDSSMSLDTESNNQVQIAVIKMPEIAVAVQTDQVNTGIPERPLTELQLPVPSITTVAISAPVVTEVAPVSEPIRPPQTETTAIDTPTNTIANALIDRTNPLNDMLNGQQQVPQSNTVFAGPAVKSGTADNDLAGGVSISQIARVPAGFDVYQNLAIREIAFYQPREIYRGQRTVDNVRALRSLGQDAKHQEMVDQQYRR